MDKVDSHDWKLVKQQSLYTGGVIFFKFVCSNCGYDSIGSDESGPRESSIPWCDQHRLQVCQSLIEL